MKRSVIILCGGLLLAAGCEKQKGHIDTDRLLQADAEPGQWMSLGRDYKQQHYSPLTQINASTVGDLGFAWEFDARSPIGRTPRGLEATPFVVDGIMYTSGAWGFVYALDARTGRELWTYNPRVDAAYGRKACCDVVNRGVAVWMGKVYVATLDGYLVCLDAATGKEIWRTDTFTDRKLAYTITGAPQVAGKVVVIGNSGAEYGVRGYITAYDLATGKQAWRFFTVPGDPKKPFEHEELEMASKTWDPASDWASGGGGTVWGQFAYDPVLNLLYAGTGNANPYPIWYRSPAGGDNLFLSSILAINPDTGKLAWHYQTTPGEIWDYTATMNLVLAELTIGGVERNVIMLAPKNGFFYVLDRATGKLLSAKNYSRVNWASHIDLETGRPVLTGQGWYKDEPRLVIPALSGAHSWQPMSYSPQSGLVYIPEIVLPWIYVAKKDYRYTPGYDNTGIVYAGSSLPFDKKYKPYYEHSPDTVEMNILKAWNPVTQTVAWQVIQEVPTGNGGILSTAGDLVFQGTNRGKLMVYNAKTGEKLKEIFTGTGIMAAPMSYEIDGEQYVAVMAGFGGDPIGFYPPKGIMMEHENNGRILAFKLGGGETPVPPRLVKKPVPAPPSDVVVDEVLASAGKTLYIEHCRRCHAGFGDDHFAGFPDLTKMSPEIHANFKPVVYDGILAGNGMAAFNDVLSEADVAAIYHYVVGEQTRLWKQQAASPQATPVSK